MRDKNEELKELLESYLSSNTVTDLIEQLGAVKITRSSLKKSVNIGTDLILLDVGEYHFSYDSNPALVYQGELQVVKVGEIINIDSDGEMRIDWRGSTNSYYVHKCVLVKLESALDVLQKSSLPTNFSPEEMNRVVLKPEAKGEIISVLKQHENQKKIFEDWGLDDVIEYGKGMTFLFYGPPGTGKTWTAHCIAKSLGKKLLSISAAEIQTSEPGGANRNIVEAFKKAKSTKSVLFLDECDGLITDRAGLGMILSSEINTLLTEIEKYEGILILATNRADTLDPALERRISLILEFPEPDYDDRVTIWSKMLPKKLPLKEVQVEALAEYKLTGGQIKNALLNAARFAASDGSEAVTMDHFDAAIKRINKSKSLMGQSSSYRQEIVQDRIGSTTKRRKVDVSVTKG